MTGTLLGSRVWLDLYHPRLNTPYTSSPNHVLDTICCFTPLIHVSIRTKSKKCLHFYPRPIVISYRFLYFYLIITPNPRINFIQIKYLS